MRSFSVICILGFLFFTGCDSRRAKRSYWTGEFTKEEAQRIATEELSKCCEKNGCLPSQFPPPHITSTEGVPWIFIYESKEPPYPSVSIYIDKSGGVECSHNVISPR